MDKDVDNEALECMNKICQNIKDNLSTYAKSSLIIDEYGPIYIAQFYCNETEGIISYKSSDGEEVIKQLCKLINERYELQPDACSEYWEESN